MNWCSGCQFTLAQGACEGTSTNSNKSGTTTVRKSLAVSLSVDRFCCPSVRGRLIWWLIITSNIVSAAAPSVIVFLVKSVPITLVNNSHFVVDHFSLRSLKCLGSLVAETTIRRIAAPPVLLSTSIPIAHRISLAPLQILLTVEISLLLAEAVEILNKNSWWNSRKSWFKLWWWSWPKRPSTPASRNLLLLCLPLSNHVSARWLESILTLLNWLSADSNRAETKSFAPPCNLNFCLVNSLGG